MIKRTYIREKSYFDTASFARKIDTDEERASEILKSLCAKNVVRYRTPDDFDEFDAEDDRARFSCYQFKYVGLIIVGDHVLIVYPKYMTSEPDPSRFRLILKVLRKRAGSFASFQQYSHDGMIGDSRICLMLELLELYLEHGEYSNYTDTFMLNGSGEISWEKTISHQLPIISNGQPIYTDFQTRKIEQNDSDLVTRIHRGILSECSSMLSDCEILDLFDIEELPLPSASFEEIGDDETLVGVLETERSKQYVSWKQQVLELMLSFLDDAKKHHQEKFRVQCLGTSSFHVDWEKACKCCFRDMLAHTLGSLNIELSKEWRARSDSTLLEIIPGPEWVVVSLSGEEDSCGESQTFIPDLVTFDQDKSIFCILDAKYYVPKLVAGHKPKGQPGIESIAKQFIYQEAYKTFVIDNGFASVLNAFLLPADDREVRKVAYVSFPQIFGSIEKPLSRQIEVWELPADQIFTEYLESHRLSFPFTP